MSIVRLIFALSVASTASGQPAPPSPDLERVVGAYRMADGGLVRVLLLRSGLVVDDGGGPRRGLQPTSSGDFETRDAKARTQLSFAGPRDRATSIVLRADAPARVGQRVDVPEETLRPYVGVYPFSEALAMHVTLENGRLIVQATGASRHPLFPESATRFFVQDYATEDVAGLEFGRTADGRAFVVVRQNGSEGTVYRR